MKLRKIFAAVMACSIVCGAPEAVGTYQPVEGITAAAADVLYSGKCGDNATWSLDSEGTLTISGTGEIATYLLDESYKNETGADFYDSKYIIKKAVVKNGITNLPEYIFGGGRQQNLVSVELPNSLKTIGYAAFTGCWKLESIIIPESVEYIDDGAFDGCSKLESIKIPESVQYIGGGAFRDTKWLENKVAESSPVIVNSILIDGQGCSGDIVIPNEVKLICGAAFAETRITSVEIPNSVTKIGNSAFYNCNELKNVTILNPNCEIDENPGTFSNGRDKKLNILYNGVIKGYEGSTAKAYANKWEYKFEALTPETPTSTTITTTKQTTTTTTTEATTTTTTTTTTAKPTTTTTTTTLTASTTTTTSTTAQETTTTTTTATTAPVSTTSADTRFVGTWTETEPKLSVTDAPMVFCFNADGTGSYRWKNDPSGFYVNVLWRAEDDILYMDEQVEDGGTVTYKFSFKDGTLIFTTTGGSAVTSELRKEESVSLGDPTGDGKVDSKDASFVLVEYAKLSTGGESSLTEAEKNAADVNKDGKNDSKDASIILSYYAYISTSGTDSLEEFLKNQ